jgi:Ca2+:H+ antiporter
MDVHCFVSLKRLLYLQNCSFLFLHLRLIVVTTIVGVCAEFLVSAIEEVTKVWHISETFVGLILIPIVGNAAEHLTAVTCALKNKMDLALGVAVGSSMQIALLVTPLMVIIGWGMQVEMSLFFNIYETAVLLIAVIMVNYLIMVSFI